MDSTEPPPPAPPETDGLPEPAHGRRSPVAAILLALLLLAAGVYGYWRFIYYPTTPQYTLEQFFAAARSRDYNRVYELVQVPPVLRSFVGNGQELGKYAERFPGLVPVVEEYRFGKVTENGDHATVETTATTRIGDKTTSGTVPFQLVRSNGVWRLDGNWIVSEATRHGLSGMFLNSSEP